MKINKTYLHFIIILILLKAILLTTVFLGYNVIPFNQKMYDDNFKFFDQQDSFLGIWQPWDSQWYLKIARDGYFTEKVEKISDVAVLAFFPLFPLLIYLFNFIFNGRDAHFL